MITDIITVKAVIAVVVTVMMNSAIVMTEMMITAIVMTNSAIMEGVMMMIKLMMMEVAYGTMKGVLRAVICIMRYLRRRIRVMRKVVK